MYGQLALQLSRAQSRKSQRLLIRSRGALIHHEVSQQRSAGNLARSYATLADPPPAEAGRLFTVPLKSETD